MKDDWWREIPGWRWPYRISRAAEVQRLHPNGRWKTLKPTTPTGRARARICMCRADGTRQMIPLVWLVADAFLGGRKPGDAFVHRNGVKTDCSVQNLMRVPQSRCPYLSGKPRRRPIFKVDEAGNILEAYGSVTEAAEANGLTRSYVTRRCRHQVLDGPGISFRYEDDMGEE